MDQRPPGPPLTDASDCFRSYFSSHCSHGQKYENIEEPARNGLLSAQSWPVIVAANVGAKAYGLKAWRQQTQDQCASTKPRSNFRLIYFSHFNIQ
jgi:hypothetical protein